MIETEGNLTVDGPVQNLVDNESADVILIATGTNSDVSFFGDVRARSGFVTVFSDDTVLLDSSTTISTGATGNISIVAGVDGVAGDSSDSIRMSEGSQINNDAGVIRLNASRGSDVFLSEVESNGTGTSVLIDAGQNVIDNTASEDANVKANFGRVRFISGLGVGSVGVGDIDIESRSLQFDTIGAAFVSDLSNGIAIDMASRSDGGGEFRSSEYLNILAPVTLGDSTTFVAESSAARNDILIENVDVRLNNPTSATFDLRGR